LEFPACSGHLEIVERFLDDSRVNPADYHNTAIIGAAKRGYLKVVQRLMQDPRVDPSDRSNTAIRKAACYGYQDIVECLLQDSRVARRSSVASRLVCA